ncbi:MAG: hypothetical protein IJD37_05595 [Clostridia bacterium]|nr:hypothetical protein [Clostridia bacterium]
MEKNYTFYKTFKAPEGDYRQIVMDYMMKMANTTWIAGEDFSITWKKLGDFKVDLNFTKGETYYGIPYSQARASLDQFYMFAKDGEEFTSPNYYYEEMVGNHCSSSIGLAYQQLIDFPFEGRLKPCKAREGIISFVNGLQKPETDEYFTQDIFDLNGQDAVFEAYASVKSGDIINKIKPGTGHARMARSVTVVRDSDGKINPEESIVYCIEQTNEFDKTRTDRKTTWWIDRAYTFQKLWNTNFMPLTLDIFHTKEPLKDAYIAFDGKNDNCSIKTGINGTVSSNFPLAYVRAYIKNTEGNTVSEIYKYKFAKQYDLDLSDYYSELNIQNLPDGKYTYTLRAGIGRGGCEIEKFDFTID